MKQQLLTFMPKFSGTPPSLPIPRNKSRADSYDTAPTPDTDDASMSLTIYPSPGLDMFKRNEEVVSDDDDETLPPTPPPNNIDDIEDFYTGPAPPVSLFTPTQIDIDYAAEADEHVFDMEFSDADLLDMNYTEAALALLKTTKSHLTTSDLPRAHVVSFANDLPDAMVFEHANPMPPFDSVRFFEQNPNDPTDTHYYEIVNPANGQYERCRGSATAVCGKPFDKFDAVAQSERIAADRRTFGEYQNKSAAEIRVMWEFGSESGSAFHRAAEYFLNLHVQLLKPPACDHKFASLLRSAVFQTIEFRYFLNFVREHIVGKHEILRTELRLSDYALTREGTTAHTRLLAGGYYPNDPMMQVLLPAVKLAGSADLVCRRRDADQNVVQIWDWKRSKKIRDSSWQNKFGKWPCDSMPDCNLSKYYIQLNVYKWMLEHNSEDLVERMCIVVFHPNNESYMLYEVPDLQDKVQRLMVERLRENRDRVYTSSSAEDVRYRAVIDEFFATAPKDPTDFCDFLRSGSDNQKPSDMEKQ